MRPSGVIAPSLPHAFLWAGGYRYNEHRNSCKRA